VLDVTRHPEIRFESTSIREEGDGLSIRGWLSLKGARREIGLLARQDGERYVAEALIDQRDFGIKPFSAMLGALKVRPEVTVRIEAPCLT
jgi:polyisoprenoid-binding protein YceI